MEITSTQYHNAHANQYDESYQNPYWKMYNEVTWHYLKQCLPRSKKNSLILDAGGGTGLWSIKIAELGFKVILSDVSKGMLDVARQKINNKNLQDLIEIVEIDITDMRRFKKGQFDLSIAEGDPVSYCSNPKKAIKELSRVTKRGGFVTVSVDNKLNWAARYIKLGEFEKADTVLKKGVGTMQSEKDGEFFKAHMFTVEDLQHMFKVSHLKFVKAVGKTVFAPFDQTLNNPEIYKKYLEFEKKYSSIPSVAGRGGHIAVIGKKM